MKVIQLRPSFSRDPFRLHSKSNGWAVSVDFLSTPTSHTYSLAINSVNGEALNVDDVEW